jgi:chromosome segregation ATPase
MASQRNPLFGVESRHTIDVNLNFNAEQILFMVQTVVDYLSLPTSHRFAELEEDMRQVKTLLRELREGLDALRADEAGDDARDAANTLTIEQKEARIKELEALKVELEARPTLTDAQQSTLEAMVVELGELTGNVITDDEAEDPADDDDNTDPDQGNEPTVP